MPKGINKQKAMTMNDLDDDDYFHSRKSSDSKTVFSAELPDALKKTTPEKLGGGGGYFSDNEDPASTDRRLNPKNEHGSLFKFNKSEVNSVALGSPKAKVDPS